VDFGNVQRIPCRERRVALAKFYIAMAKDFSEKEQSWNDKEIANAFAAVGGKSMKGDIKFLTVNALLGYNMRYDWATLSWFGIRPDMSNILDIYGSDSFKEFPADLVNLQRLCQTLVGVGSIIGAGQLSCTDVATTV